MLRYTFYLLLFPVVLVSCTHDPVGIGNINPGDTTITTNPPPDTSGGTDTVPVVICSTDTVYFKQAILPLLVNSCGRVGCHSPETASDGVVIADYNSILQTGKVRAGDPDGSDLYEVLVEDDEDKIMPPPPEPRMSSGNIALVRKWIQQGARNNSCEPSSGCDVPASVTYAGVVRPIFQANCFGCHSSSVATGGIILDTYQGASSAASSGRLIGAVKQRPGFRPMPPGGPLKACDIKKIEEWISQGLKP
jgi:hypothetical protein